MDLTKLINELNSSFDEFKKANDERLKQLEKGNAVDPIVQEKVDKLEKRLEEVDAAYQKAMAVINRPAYASEEKEGGSIEPFKKALYSDRRREVEVTNDEVNSYKKAFNTFLRRGEKAMTDAEYKSITIGTASAGGYLVQPEMYNQIIEYVIEAAPVRQFASVTTIGTDQLEVPRATGGTAAGWVGESDARPATTTETFGQVVITAHELYANPPVSSRALEDTMFDVEAFLSRRIGQVFGQMQSDAFINGNGTNQPVGLLDAAGGLSLNVTSGTVGAIKLDDLIDAEEQLKTSYRPGARWMIGRNVIAAIRKLKDTNGQYLWQPAVAAGQPSTLMGYPVLLAEQMPALATGNKAVALVNLRDAYLIVDRHDIRVLRDPYTNKPFTHFYTVQRVGGAVVNQEAGVTITIG